MIKTKLIKILSTVLIVLGTIILLVVFTPPTIEEIRFRYHQAIGTLYYVGKTDIENDGDIFIKRQEIIPQDTDFGIVIPKINANAPIFANIDPFSEREFLPILRKGVAHAKNSSFPGHGSNIYLFAHSASGILSIKQYNAVFYLINKLEKNDEIVIYYKEKPYSYFVFEKKIVGFGAIKYLDKTNEEILTLQTCYPPGTTLQRLIVKAKPIENLDNR
ncbi:MAG: sortase [Candidatus Shapirobacteria bacterium]|nr:sortase [Candidatus Shapirobacteria bacterium]